MAVIKRAALSSVLAWLFALLLHGCASNDEPSSTGSASQPAAGVPGEHVSDDRYGPGPMGSAGNVRW